MRSHISAKNLRRLASVGALTSLACALAGCSGSPGDSDTRTLRAGVIYAPSVAIVRCGLDPLADDERLSDAGIEIQTTDSAQLGSEDELIQQASTGELDIALAAGSTLATEFGIPELEMFEAYYLYETVEDVSRARNSKIGQEVWGRLPDEANLQPVGDPWLYGERHIFGNEALREPEDFKGVKFRVPETDISIASARALGASPTPIAYAELYLGLQQGIVDVAEAPLNVIKAESFDEPSSYINLTGHLITAASPLINNDAWTSLSAEQRDVVTTALSEASQRVADCVAEDDEKALAEWKEAGDLEVVEDVDKEALRSLAEEAYSQGQPWSESYKLLLKELHG